MAVIKLRSTLNVFPEVKIALQNSVKTTLFHEKKHTYTYAARPIGMVYGPYPGRHDLLDQLISHGNDWS